MFRTACATTLVIATLVSAAEAQDHDGRIGLGVRLNPIAIGDLDFDSSVLPIGLGNFTVPIRLGESVRLEPELGIFRSSSNSSGTGFSGSSNGTLLRYGLALHYFFGDGGPFRTYAGAHGGFLRRTTKSTNSGSPTYETKRTDNYFGLALGGEYWFTPRFSLGAEVQLNRVGFGDEEVTPDPGSSGNFDASFISNNGVIALRFYL